MPEGDTIHRTARALRGALAGRSLDAFASPLPALAATAARLTLVGRRVEAVESRGKHLLIRFEGGAVLHTHMKMQGRWSLYRDRLPWPRLPERARAMLQAGPLFAVCYGAPIVELLSRFQARDHPALARLGPDLLAPGFEAETAVSLRGRPDATVASALLDQTALAGIGNVFKSETLFIAGIHPATRVAALDTAALTELVGLARKGLSRNLGHGVRRTTPLGAGARLWVYGRAGRACLRCGETIERAVTGDPPRSTYWCPACQPALDE